MVDFQSETAAASGTSATFSDTADTAETVATPFVTTEGSGFAYASASAPASASAFGNDFPDSTGPPVNSNPAATVQASLLGVAGAVVAALF